MKTQNLINYFFSVGFILLIIFFLTSMIAISRIVLTQNNSSISKHIIETNELISNATKIEQKVIKSQTLIFKSTNPNKNSINIKDFNISQINYININSNKTIITFFLKGPINKTNRIYFKPQKNVKKGDYILYNKNKTGIVYSISKNTTTILNKNQKIIKIENSKILGLIFLIDKK